jgi:hypothetical protein
MAEGPFFISKKLRVLRSHRYGPNRVPKRMSALLLMTPTAHLPVHGRPYPASILKPFLAQHTASWLVPANEPHVCRVAGCALMRAHVRSLWSRVARRAVTRRIAHLALARVFPADIASRVVYALRPSPPKSEGKPRGVDATVLASPHASRSAASAVTAA